MPLGHQAQVLRLRGLELSGETDASHSLIDLVFQMSEDNQLKYVRWEQATKRDQELMGLPPDSSGVFREVKSPRRVQG